MVKRMETGWGGALVEDISGDVLVEDFRRVSLLKVALTWRGKPSVLTCIGSLGRALTRLNLSGTGIGAGNNAEMLAGVLEECKALAHLTLSSTSLGKGVGRLAMVLGGCKALVHLDLSDNNFGNEGATRIADVLGKCKALTRLDLTGT
mmetsp:Transcript_21565/g.51136  ORF Transcript_21565/g.51136 Transcript_21565/m.51136 type:complete len:148 (+) Transcript_21565:3-446(+)